VAVEMNIADGKVLFSAVGAVLHVAEMVLCPPLPFMRCKKVILGKLE
jgi:hypothetical protein